VATLASNITLRPCGALWALNPIPGVDARGGYLAVLAVAGSPGSNSSHSQSRKLASWGLSLTSVRDRGTVVLNFIKEIALSLSVVF